MFSIEILKKLVKERVNTASFENVWQQIISDFARWQSSMMSRSTSGLNAQLELLKIICATFPKAQFYKDKVIADLMLSGSGARDIGFNFKCRLPNGRSEMVTVIDREITDKFGILYTLETAEGFRFTREFFD